ncbi:MAG: IS66 family transposase [Crocinitomicaceae bacterium]|nr:IS66 family transposase [Crocinitomicaceae bacterium]
MSLPTEIQEQHELVKELLARIASLEETVRDLKFESAALKAENADLRARLNGNSHNSSRPPSSDGYTKKPAFPKKKKGKQGGQPGHKGRTLDHVPEPDKVVQCNPDKCYCGHVFNDEDVTVSEKRQVFDLPQPCLEITEYQIGVATCRKCGQLAKGVAPEGVNARAQYGNGVRAYAVLLNVHFKLPFKKIQLLFEDLFGYAINESTVYAASQKCYDNLEASEKEIKQRIADSNVTHADETGLRVAGKLHWLHTATTQGYTYLFIHEKRGAIALEGDKSILNQVKGWLVHDCWSSYFSFTQLKHALCGAHILRELEGLIERGQSKWSEKFKPFLMRVYLMPFEERIRRREWIESEYSRICSVGEKQEPPPIKTSGKRGRYKRTKGRNLVERLIREKDAMLAFAFNEEVPFTNNLAERDIRPAKVKQKISNCFRTFLGAEIYARIEGFVSTARKQNRNVFTELRDTFEGHNFITKDPS